MQNLMGVGLAGGMLLWTAVATAGFEGTIWMKETTDGEVTSHRIHFKGDKVRMEEVGGEADGGAVVVDGTRRESFVIDADEQAYFLVPWFTPTPEELKQELDGVVVTKTGKKDTIVGYPCEGYLERDKTDGSTTELCIAKGFGYQALFGLSTNETALGSLIPLWLRERLKEGAFPLRSIERDKSGMEVSRFEATKVEAKKLDDSLFRAPKGYRRMSLDEVGRGRRDG